MELSKFVPKKDATPEENEILKQCSEEEQIIFAECNSKLEELFKRKNDEIKKLNVKNPYEIKWHIKLEIWFQRHRTFVKHEINNSAPINN